MHGLSEAVLMIRFFTKYHQDGIRVKEHQEKRNFLILKNPISKMASKLGGWGGGKP